MATIIDSTQTVKTVGGSSNAYTHRLEVIQNSQNISNNSTNFTMNGYIKPNHSSWGWSQFYSPKMILYYTKNGIRTNVAEATISQVATNNTNYQHLATATFDIPHNNDGTLDVTFGYEFSPNTTSYNYVSSSSAISGFATIKTIPRYASITSFTATSAIKSITCNWAADAITSAVQYSLNGGGWVTASSSDSSYGTFTIENLKINTTYKVKIQVRRKDSGLWTTSQELTIKTLKSGVFSEKQNGMWKEANPYLKVNGVWKEANPYLKVNGVWKQTSRGS